VKPEPLTDAQVDRISKSYGRRHDFARAIQAARDEQWAAPQAPAPLTDEQLTQMRLDARESNKVTLEHWWILFARAIEKAHGITEAQG